MKKALTIALVWMCLFVLVGCDPGANMVDGDELLENTVKIELYYYENKNPKLIKLNGKKMPTFDFDNATLISALEESQFEAVIEDIAKQQYLIFGNALNEPIGKTLILYQENGNMVVFFGCVYDDGKTMKKYFGDCNVFDENGFFIEHIGRIDTDYVDTLESIYFGNNT